MEVYKNYKPVNYIVLQQFSVHTEVLEFVFNALPINTENIEVIINFDDDRFTSRLNKSITFEDNQEQNQFMVLWDTTQDITYKQGMHKVQIVIRNLDNDTRFLSKVFEINILPSLTIADEIVETGITYLENWEDRMYSLEEFVKSLTGGEVDPDILKKFQLKIDTDLKTPQDSVVGAINAIYADTVKNSNDISTNIASTTVNKNNIETLTDNIQENATELNNLKTEVDTIHETVNTNTTEIGEVKVNVSTNTDGLKKAKTDIVQNTADISALQNKSSQIDTKLSDLEQSTTALNNNLNTLSSTVANNTNSISTLNEQIQNIEPFDKTILNDYQKKVDNDLIGDDKNLISVVNKNVNSINSVATDVNTNKADIANLKTRVDNIQPFDETKLNQYQTKQDNALETQSKQVVTAINEVNSKSNTNTSQLNDLNTKVNNNTTEVTNLSSEISTVKTNLQSTNSEVSDLKTQVDSIPSFDESKLDKYQTIQSDSLTTTNKTIPTAINEINANTNNNSTEINSIKQQLDDIEPFDKSVLNDYQTKVDATLNIADGNIVKAIQLNNSEIQSNKAQITLNTNSITSNTNTITETNNKLNTAETKLNDLKNKVDTLTPFDETKLDSYQKKTDDTLNTDVKTVTGAINELKTDIDENTQAIVSLNSTTSATSTELKALKTTVDDIKITADMNADDLNSATADLQKLKTDFSTLNGSVSTNTNQITTLKEKVDSIEPFDKTVLNNYQLKSDNTLDTQNKEIVKAINEINTKATTNSTTLTEHSNSISENTSKISQNTTNINENLTKINKNISDITDLKTKTDTLETNITSNTSKITDLTTKVDSIEPFNPAVLDSYQTKEDTTLTTINKEVVKAINEVNNVANQNNQQITNVKNQISTLQPKDDNNINGDDKNVVSVINKLLSGSGGSSFEGAYSDNEKVDVSAGISRYATIEGDNTAYIDAGVLAFTTFKNITDSNMTTFFGRYFTLEGSVGYSVGVLNQGEIKNSTGVFLGKDIQSENCTDVVVIGNRASATNATRSVIIGNSGGISGDDPNSKVDNIYVFGNSEISNQSNYVFLGNSYTQNLYCNATYITHPCDPRLKENIKSADEQIITDALKQVNIIHASYKNFKEFQGNRASDLKKLMYDADNISQIKLFSKDVKTYDRYVTPLNENGEPVATYTTLDDDGNEVIEPVQELIEECKEFTPNQITPALIVGWQAHEKRIAELEKENALLKQEIENIKQALANLNNK